MQEDIDHQDNSLIMDHCPGQLGFIKGFDVVSDGLDFVASQKFAFERFAFVELFAIELE